MDANPSSTNRHGFADRSTHGTAKSEYEVEMRGAARPAPPQPPAASWWTTRVWYRYLADLLLYRGRQRYTLSLSETHPLGATDPQRRLVCINPTAVAYPTNVAERRRIRGFPVGRREAFEQAIATALVEHEAGHIRFSGTKPEAETLGWLWNVLEDERQERLLAQQYPSLAPLFSFLGDAVWRMEHPTDDLLAGCLLWRWEHDLPQAERKFIPASSDDLRRWDECIQPLVERAWVAPTSDDVTVLARQILQLLHRPEDAPTSPDLPESLCGCKGGHAGGSGPGADPGPQGHAGDSPAQAPERAHAPGSHAPSAEPTPPPGAHIPGRTGRGGVGSGQGHLPDDPAQADPSPLLAQVEGAARDLARWLRPPTPLVRPRPHPSDGELDLERVLAGHPRPFDRELGPAPAPSRAWYLLVDESGSMGNARTEGSTMSGAVRVALWLHRATELASVPFGVAGFDGGTLPIHIRPLSTGPNPLAERRLAGMDGSGGTRLAPAFAEAVAALRAAQVQRRLLVVLHDGDLGPTDARAVEQMVTALPRASIRLLPLYLGDDADVIAANTELFGYVLACATLESLTQRVSAWLRADGA